MSDKPTPLSGFPELLPEHRSIERGVVAGLSRTFELHGFANIETRAVEPLDRLSKGGEVDKEIYVLRRLQAAADDPGDTGLGLHFDLTVPFARYVLEHAGQLEFPFRRFQIQPVWRGERPQIGRYRQFTQADVDIVGRDVLPFHHDVEVARVMLDALSRLDFLPPLTLQVNNRKLIQGFYAGIGATDLDEVMRVVDKLDKLSEDEVRKLLVAEAGLDDAQAEADQLVGAAGGVHPLTGFAMGALAGGDLRAVLQVEDADDAPGDADARAQLAAGPAPGQGGDFSDRFSVEAAGSDGREIILDLRPQEGSYVLSDLTSGPVLFATC